MWVWPSDESLTLAIEVKFCSELGASCPGGAITVEAYLLLSAWMPQLCEAGQETFEISVGPELSLSDEAELESGEGVALGDCELSLEGVAFEDEEAELVGEVDAFEREEGRRALTLLTEVGTEARDEVR